MSSEWDLKSEDLVGYSGNSFLDTGYFYAPYVPMVSTSVVLDPNTWIPKKGLLTRYGKKILAQGEEHYQTAQIKPKEYRSIDAPFEVSYSKE